MVVPVPLPGLSVRDIADGVKLIGDVIDSTRTILEAINDGKKYLEREAPDTKRYWADLMQQMQLTVTGLAEVTGVVSGFSFGFDASGDPRESDLDRFNNYVISQKAKVAALKGRARQLKGSSRKVRELRGILNNYTGNPGWSSMWGLLGKKGRHDAESLASLLGNFYADDMRLADTIDAMIEFSEHAIAEVDNTLGPPGQKYASNIPIAAEVLGVLADTFAERQRILDDLVLRLDETREQFATA